MKVTKAESLIMEALWREAPLAAEEVLARLESQSWSLRTAKTLLARLLNKGVIAAQLEGRRYMYRPMLRREDYVAAESEGLVERLFGGRISPLMVHFAEQKKFTKEDIKVIKRLIEDLEDGG